MTLPPITVGFHSHCCRQNHRTLKQHYTRFNDKRCDNMCNIVFWVVDKIYYIVQFSRINQLDARACVFRLAAYVIYKHIIHNTGPWCELPRCH